MAAQLIVPLCTNMCALAGNLTKLSTGSPPHSLGELISWATSPSLRTNGYSHSVELWKLVYLCTACIPLGYTGSIALLSTDMGRK